MPLSTGEELALRLKVSKINWNGGDAYISIGEDVTESIWIERELQKRHLLLNQLSEQIPGVIYQFRLFPDGRSCFPFSSERMKEIYEVNPEQVREDASLVFERIHPEDSALVEESIRASASDLTTWTCDYRVVLPEQGICWRCGIAVPQKLDDGSILWHGFIEDSTERKETAERLAEYNLQLERVRVGTLSMLTRLVDYRDPYTAGHQEGVAQIAKRIATELGISGEQLDNFELACLVHDIGKVAVPAEILSKPTELTMTEFKLIKQHPQTGYDIVKDGPLPNVVAETILQHHERLDGSGYPRGLSGQEIIEEAEYWRLPMY